MKLFSFLASLSKLEKIIYLTSFIWALSVFLYSFTQVDLGLALTRFPSLFTIQRAFQIIGYFQRPLSTNLFLGISLLGFVLYGVLLYSIWKGKIGKKSLWVLFLGITGLLTFSYNAFSYDLFNYIFDAKIFTIYGKNPYEFKPLDFPQDSMLSFMHWTHRTYPYGPLWLVLTIPFSFLGMGSFLFTFFLFKALIATCFVFLVKGMYQLFEYINEKTALFFTVLFAANPLVLYESVVSAHNDIAMFVFAIWAFVFLLRKNYLIAFIFLGVSIGMKFATVFLLPAFLLLGFFVWKKQIIKWDVIGILCFLWMGIAFYLASERTVVQPWYLLYILTFLFFAGMIKERILLVFTLSLLGVLQYVPFLYTGEWSEVINRNFFWTMVTVLILFGGVVIVKNALSLSKKT